MPGIPLSYPPPVSVRDKLLAGGPTQLSDRELLAVFLDSRPAKGGSRVRDQLMPEEGQWERFTDLGLADLLALPGVGQAAACRLYCLPEVTRRMAESASRAGLIMGNAETVYRWMRGRLVGERREWVHVLLLDARRRWIGERCVSVGSLSSSSVHPREVFRPAIGLAASAIVLVHNHPSGDPTPSVEDHQVTVRLAEVGALVSIQLLDHVIVATEGYRSFRDEGWLPDTG